MANNDSGNGQDPWKRDDDQPVELDQIVQDWQKRFGSILGGGGSGANGGGGSIALIVLLGIAWLLTGFYRVDAAERGVVQRFGKHVYVPCFDIVGNNLSVHLTGQHAAVCSDHDPVGVFRISGEF